MSVVMNVVTGGTAGEAIRGVEVASSLLEKANTVQDIMAAEGTLAAQLQAIQSATQKDLASVTNSVIASQVAAKYVVGSPTYNSIVNVWTQVYLAASSKEFAMQAASQVIAMSDPTGIIGLIQTFNQPMCGQHSPMP